MKCYINATLARNVLKLCSHLLHIYLCIALLYCLVLNGLQFCGRTTLNSFVYAW